MECIASHSPNYTPGCSGAHGNVRPARGRVTFGPSLPGWVIPLTDGLFAYLISRIAPGIPATREKNSHGSANITRAVSVLGSPSRHRTTDISQDERTTDLEFGYPIEYNGWFSGLYTGLISPYTGLDRALSSSVSRQLSYPSRRLGSCIARLKWQSPKCGWAVSLPLVAVAR